MNMDKFYKMCTPARIYFVVSVFGAVLALLNNVPIISVAMKFIFILLWTYVLGFLCKKGYSTISWILVLLPFIVMMLAMMGANNPMMGQMMYRMNMY